MKRSAARLALLSLLAVVLSAASTVVTKVTGSWLVSFGPNGIVGGWPVSFIEYDFSEFYRNCVDCTFAIPSGNFLILGVETSYSLGKFYYGYFIVNTLLWIVLVFTALMLVKTVRKAIGKFSDKSAKRI